MALDSFSSIKTALTNWLARSDLSSYYNDFIFLGEKRLARDLRIRAIETSLSITLSSGIGTIPADFLELKHARLDIAGGWDLEMREADWVYELHPNRTPTSRPIYIGVDGTDFVFGPYPDADYVVNGTYYKQPAILSDVSPTNEWTANTGDALLMAALAESAPFLRDDERLQVWESKYMEIKKGYTANYKRQARRQTRVSTR